MSMTSMLTLTSSVAAASVITTVKHPEIVAALNGNVPTAFVSEHEASDRFDRVVAELDNGRPATVVDPIATDTPRRAESFGLQRWRQIMEIGRTKASQPTGKRNRDEATQRASSSSRTASGTSQSVNRNRSVFERSRFGRQRELSRRLNERARTYRPINLPQRRYSLNAVGNRSIFERSRSYRESGSRYPMHIRGRTIRSTGRR